MGIKVQDSGIGLSIKSFTGQAKKFGSPEESASGIDLPLNTIEELTRLHGGEIEYKEEMQKGGAPLLSFLMGISKIRSLRLIKKKRGWIIMLCI